MSCEFIQVVFSRKTLQDYMFCVTHKPIYYSQEGWKWYVWERKGKKYLNNKWKMKINE